MMERVPVAVSGSARLSLGGVDGGGLHGLDAGVLKEGAGNAARVGRAARQREGVRDVRQRGVRLPAEGSEMVEGALLGVGLDPVLDRNVPCRLRRVDGVAGGVHEEHDRNAQHVLEAVGEIGNVLPLQAMPGDEMVRERPNAGVGRVAESQEALDVVATRRGVTHGQQLVVQLPMGVGGEEDTSPVNGELRRAGLAGGDNESMPACLRRGAEEGLDRIVGGGRLCLPQSRVAPVSHCGDRRSALSRHLRRSVFLRRAASGWTHMAFTL